MGQSDLELVDGYGDGSGYGSGSGDGSGYGYGGLSQFLSAFRQEGVIPAYWRSTNEGSPSNGGSGTIARVGFVEEIKGPLKLCTKNALHGTTDPSRWKGERWWIVQLHEPVQRDGDKIASLKRTFVMDLGKCPL